jgi:hypothetical protein
LNELSKEAKKKEVEIRIRTEYSNFYQGTIVEVQRLNDRVESKILEKLTKDYHGLQALTSY